MEQSFITKSNARQYEKELKKELKSWADDNQMEKVKHQIHGNIDQEISGCENTGVGMKAAETEPGFTEVR